MLCKSDKPSIIIIIIIMYRVCWAPAYVCIMYAGPLPASRTSTHPNRYALYPPPHTHTCPHLQAAYTEAVVEQAACHMRATISCSSLEGAGREQLMQVRSGGGGEGAEGWAVRGGRGRLPKALKPEGHTALNPDPHPTPMACSLQPCTLHGYTPNAKPYPTPMLPSTLHPTRLHP